MSVQSRRSTGQGEAGAQAPVKERLWPWWLLTLAAFVALWHLGGSLGYLSVRSFSTPAEVLAATWEWHTTGESVPHLAFTFQAVVTGYIIGVALGSVAAAMFVAFPRIAEILDPFMAIMNGVPKVILAPPLVLVLGLGMASKVAVAVSLVFFLAFFNVVGGLRSVDQTLLANLKVLGASRWSMVRDLYAPAIVTWIMSTLRLGIGFAVAGVIVAEFMGAEYGLGLTMKRAGERLDPALLIGGLLTLALVVAIVDRGLIYVERRFSGWRLL